MATSVAPAACAKNSPITVFSPGRHGARWFEHDQGSGTCCSVLVSGSGRHLRVSIWRSGHAVRPGGDVAAVEVVAEALQKARLISGAGAWVFWGDREHGALLCGEVP